MRIVKVESWLTKLKDDDWCSVKPFLFVKVTSFSGYVGWGEAFTLGARERGTQEIVRALEKIIVEKDDIDPRTFYTLAREIECGHPGIEFSSACSSIEIALWDVAGKEANLPLYKLLDPSGVNINREVVIYASVYSDQGFDLNALKDRCISCIQQYGFEAIKIFPPHSFTVTEVEGMVKCVREAIGDSARLVVDLTCCNDVERVISIATAIAPYNPHWLEEPVDGEDHDSLSKIRSDVGLKIVSGERHVSLYHFKALIRHNLADILNPDIAAVGIIDILNISQYAHEHGGIGISPHCWNSMSMAASAMYHVCAVMPNAEMCEFFPHHDAHKSFCKTSHCIRDGKVFLSDAPGLGITIDEDSLIKLAL